MVFGLFKGFGRLPAAYNEKVHGPYDPAVYYGKKDIPLAEVKVGELPAWLARRNKSPTAMIACASRAHWRFLHKYAFPRKAGITMYLQLIVGMMAFFYVLNYEKLRYHAHYKYHW